MTLNPGTPHCDPKIFMRLFRAYLALSRPQGLEGQSHHTEVSLSRCKLLLLVKVCLEMSQADKKID